MSDKNERLHADFSALVAAIDAFNVHCDAQNAAYAAKKSWLQAKLIYSEHKRAQKLLEKRA